MEIDQPEHFFGANDNGYAAGSLMGSVAMGRETPYPNNSANSIHFQNVELIRIINDLKKKDTQIEAAKKLDQYMHQY